MSFTTLIRLIGLLLTSGIVGCHRVPPQDLPSPNDDQRPAQQDFRGLQAGEQREVAGIPLCWCPAGKFLMGSPPDEPERRPGEDQVEVVLTKGFWMAKYETTQGQWKQVIGQLPGELTAELPEGDDYPLGNVNFAEAEAFCQKLTEAGRKSGDLPEGWEFRLPTEAQWEYACRLNDDRLGRALDAFFEHRHSVLRTKWIPTPRGVRSSSGLVLSNAGAANPLGNRPSFFALCIEH